VQLDEPKLVDVKIQALFEVADAHHGVQVFHEFIVEPAAQPPQIVIFP
jgi:hypothetical protein